MCWELVCRRNAAWSSILVVFFVLGLTQAHGFQRWSRGVREETLLSRGKALADCVSGLSSHVGHGSQPQTLGNCIRSL